MDLKQWQEIFNFLKLFFPSAGLLEFFCGSFPQWVRTCKKAKVCFSKVAMFFTTSSIQVLLSGPVLINLVSFNSELSVKIQRFMIANYQYLTKQDKIIFLLLLP